ncbi:MAG: HAMP domain-containing histidine kinase [Candidatus Brocadiales bacterium]|nr:HAMP domain-containing histidine kinase [Candidatus Brocadiales bacterium]
MPYNTHTPEKSPLEKELIESLLRFINLRWIIVVGICITSIFARLVLKISLPLTPILFITFCILIFNVVCIYFQKNVKSYESFANLQISVDWIALVFLVHYTGGTESPVIFYFIFHVIIAAILLSKKDCYLQTGFAALLIISLSILEYFSIIHHVHIQELFPNPVYDNGIYLLSIIFFSITSLYISAYLATSVNSRLRKRENEILTLKNDIADAYNKLEAIDREKSEFTYKVTHELRSPLSAIQSLLKSIEEGYAGDISQKAMDLITRSEKRTSFLLTLVNDLLDLVSGKIGKPKEGDTKSIDINVAVKNTLHLMQEKTKAKNLKIIIKATPEPSYLKIVPDDLDIILTNLIDNSVKYTEQGGTISINSIITNKEIKLEMADTGIGIIKEDLNKIFNEFYRSKNAKAVELRGTGLGLSIVKNLIKQYRGSIDVMSEIGKGTTVTISFPADMEI